jgi:hypothetical protein
LLELIAYGKLLKENPNKEIEKSKTRLIKEGGGNKAKLSEEEQIILMLVYLRHNITFQLLGILFEVSESTAHNLFNYWQKLFQENLPPSLLEQAKKSPEEMETILEICDESFIPNAMKVIEKNYLANLEQKMYSKY